VVRPVQRFDFRLVVNEERNLLNALIQTLVLDRIYMFFPDIRLE
jgi:tRNA G46 methylase TrmB